MARTIVAVDPGPHTGLAIQTASGGQFAMMVHNQIYQLWNFLIRAKPEVIIVERFVGSVKLNQERTATIEIVGSVINMAYILNAELYIQYAGDRMAFVSEARKLLNKTKAKIDSHEVDAMAHLLRWLYFDDAKRKQNQAAGKRGETSELYIPEEAKDRKFRIFDARGVLGAPDGTADTGPSAEVDLDVAEGGVELPEFEVRDGFERTGEDSGDRLTSSSELHPSGS